MENVKYELGMLRDGVEKENRDVRLQTKGWHKSEKVRLAAESGRDKFDVEQNRPVKIEMRKLWTEVAKCDVFPRHAKMYQNTRQDHSSR